MHNLDQPLFNFGSQLWIFVGQLLEPILSQLLDPTLFNFRLNPGQFFVNFWVTLEITIRNYGVILGPFLFLTFQQLSKVTLLALIRIC